MEYNFRTALIVISAVVITAIFVHGFWTIRKNKNPYKLKAKSEKLERQNRGFDGSGFDQDGVSKPRVVDNLLDDEAYDQEIPMSTHSDYEGQHRSYREFSAEDDEPSLGDMSALDDITKDKDSQTSDVHVHEASLVDNVKDEEATLAKKVETTVYQTPVISAKQPLKNSARFSHKEPIKRDQIEINFGNENKKAQSTTRQIHDNTKHKKINIEPEVLIVSVVMPEKQQMSGAALLPMLLTLGMKYGDMNIFHRHEDNAGKGKVTFSLANIMNPGTFDLDNMESFTTQGISLFMTLPNVGEAAVVFEQMLNAAKQLALEFSGQLLDDKRNVMTQQTEQHYTGKIREFERRNLIASS
jgi:cell division protein ZipA